MDILRSKWVRKQLKFSWTKSIPHHPKRNYITNKTDVYSIDVSWSLEILDLNEYGHENDSGNRYVLVVIDIFSKFGWTIPLKKNAQSIKDSFENIVSKAQGPAPDIFYDYGYNYEWLDGSVCGAKIFHEIGKLEKTI